jgi:TonB family protein
MTYVPVESWSWSRRHWWGVVALIFIVQLALIFWLGETSPIRPRPAAPAFTLRLAGDAANELLTLRDPTLFVLPRPEGHPAPAALKESPPVVPPFAWPESLRPPLSAAGQLGATFQRLAATSNSIPLFPQVKHNPHPTLPELVSPPVSPGQSTIRLEGGLAGRRLVTPIELRSWPSREILTNSVVRLLVDADGLPQSVTLLVGSGSREADQHALAQAAAARFEPLGRNPLGPRPSPTADLSSGRMIFLWHTLPPPPTNTTIVSP